MVMAVLERRARVPIGGSDAYVSTVGGVRLGEPAADLAVALSVASSVVDAALPPQAVAFGEVGLAGEMRPVSGMPRRLAEAARLGFRVRVHPARSPGFRTGPRRAAGDRGGRRRWRRGRRAGRPRPTRPPRLDSPRADRPQGTSRGGRRVGGQGAVVTPVDRTDDDLLRATLAAVAPGTALRDGLERILRGRTGALIVLGNDKVVESISSGGFPLDIDFSATRLRELSKMDGAIVLDRDVNRILRANTQLVPDPSIETSESGTRHRTAERVAIQTGIPVVSVSQSMQIIALYVSGRRHVVEGQRQHPVQGEPGPSDPRALQGPPRRGHLDLVGARDRGPRHRPRRRQRAAAPRDGPPDQRGDLRLRRGARRRRPPARPPAGGAGRRSRQRP